MQNIWNTLRPQIEFFSKPFPREAIALANAHREEVAPHLVDALAQVAADPGIADGEYILHEYAMHLLGAWRDTRAYAPLVALGHHDEDTLDNVLGDSVTESYGRCLASVCDGNVGPLKALFEDPAASYWARNAALTAMVVRVLEGDGARDELIDYLIERGDVEAQRLRASGRVLDDLEVLDAIVRAAATVAATEMLARIDGWFGDGLLDTQWADKSEVQADMAEPFEVHRQRELERGFGYLRDAETEMGWWAAFKDEPWKKPAPLPRVLPVRTTQKVGRNDPCPCGSGKKYKKCHGI